MAINMKKIIALMICVVLTISVFSGCGGDVTYKDGTYTACSEKYEGDEAGNGEGYGEVKITIKNGKITACNFKTYTLEGKLKDKDYGKLTEEDISLTRRLLNAAACALSPGDALSELIDAGAAAFFRGDKTAEDAAREIQMKAALYVGEHQ